MEQRIGSSSQPLEGAGFDPAFIPGLTSPVTAEPKDGEAEDSGAESAGAEDAAAVEDAAGAEPAADSGEEASGSSEDSEVADGPVFEASDRRAKIVADHQGVRLSLDDQACEFRWDEIGAVETETPRFGKRFTVTVHTPDRRWYPIEIEATSRSRFEEWEGQLDAVLDAYFEDETAEDETAEADETDVEADETDVEAEDKADAEETDAAESETVDKANADVDKADAEDKGKA